MKVVELQTPDRKKSLRKNIQLLYERMQRGEVKSVVCIYETDGMYNHFRNCVSYEESIGLLQRSIHRINREWDEATL